MSKMSSIRTMLSLETNFNLEVEDRDVKITLLHGNLEEEFYMKHHDGFLVKGKEDYVCGLIKVYLVWSKLQDSGTRSLSLLRLTKDTWKPLLSIVFDRKFCNDDFTIMLLYVNDMFIVDKYIS